MAKLANSPRLAPTRQKRGEAGRAELERQAQYFSPSRLRMNWRVGMLARQKNKNSK